LQYDAKAKRLYVGMMDPDKPGIAVIAVRGRRCTQRPLHLPCPEIDHEDLFLPRYGDEEALALGVHRQVVHAARDVG
jgi:hypothetical protein